MSSNYDEWDQIYRKNPLESLPWETGRPRQIVAELAEKERIKKGKELDILSLLPLS